MKPLPSAGRGQRPGRHDGHVSPAMETEFSGGRTLHITIVAMSDVVHLTKGPVLHLHEAVYADDLDGPGFGLLAQTSVDFPVNVDWLVPDTRGPTTPISASY